MPRSVTPWTEPFRVHSYDVNPRGDAAIQSLCNYFQEAAGNHARELGVSREAMLESGTAWVLARLRVTVDHYPQWRDTVEVVTWPSGLERLYATREFLLRDADEQILARGTSAWLVIDVERRRPTRPPAELNELDLPDLDAPVSHPTDDVPDLESADHERRFQVRFSDLDLNQHVNNVRYVEWAVEALPEAHLTSQQLREIDIQFRAETVFGDTICTQADAADGRILHRVQREKDNRVAARATTRWTPLD